MSKTDKKVNIKVDVKSDKATKEVRKVNTALGNAKTNATSVGIEGKKGMGALNKGAGIAKVGMNGLKSAMGPILIAFAAIKAGLVVFKKVIGSSQSQLDAFNKVLLQGKAIVDEFFKRLSTGDWDGFKESVKNAVDEGSRIADIKDLIGDLNNELLISEERFEKFKKEQKAIINDANASDKQKMAAFDRIEARSKEVSELRLSIAKKETEVAVGYAKLESGLSTKQVKNFVANNSEMMDNKAEYIKQLENFDGFYSQGLDEMEDEQKKRTIKQWEKTLTGEARIWAKGKDKYDKFMDDRRKAVSVAMAGEQAAMRKAADVEEEFKSQSTSLEKRLNAEKVVNAEGSAELEANAVEMSEQRKRDAMQATADFDAGIFNTKKSKNEEWQDILGEIDENNKEDEEKRAESDVERAERDVAISKQVNADKVQSKRNMYAQIEQTASATFGAISALTNAAYAADIQAADGNEKEIKKIKIKQWRTNKALALSEAATTTALGILNALTFRPATAVPLMIGTAIAAGVTQLAAITATKMPSFQSGGIVGGTSYTGDKVPVNVNSKEMILNTEQQSRMFNMLDGGSDNSGSNKGISDGHIANIAAKVVKSIPVYVTESAMTKSQRSVKIREEKFAG